MYELTIFLTTLKRLLLMIAFVIFLNACSKDFLETPPENFISSTNFYKDQEQINAAVVGGYGYLQDLVNNIYYIADLPSDIAAKEFNDQDRGLPELFEQIDQLRINTANGLIGGKWNTIYAAVANLNVIIKKLPDAEFQDEALRARYEAEAKFLRGLNYFTAIRIWGAVPLVIEPLESADQTLNLRRSPVDEVYAQIESDLRFAAENLPEAYDSKEIGRATRYAARGVLGKVFLQQGKNAEALVEFNAIHSSGRYQLMADYKAVFDPSTAPGANTEAIFSVNFATVSETRQGAGWSYQFMPKGSVGVLGMNQGNSPVNAVQVPTSEFIAELMLQPGDKRIPVLYTPSWTDGSGAVQNQPWSPKFLYPVSGGNPSVDWPYLRYADVLLVLAELENANGYPSTAAFNYLNEVRVRADIPEYTVAELTSQAAFQLAVEQERKIELAFEGHRWYDLLRWNKVEQRLNDHFDYERLHPSSARDLISFPLPSDAYIFSNTDLLWPLDPTEINKVPGVLDQNPGY